MKQMIAAPLLLRDKTGKLDQPLPSAANEPEKQHQIRTRIRKVV